MPFDASLLTFSLYLLGMLIIGLVTFRMTGTFSDYVLGGRRMGSWVTAISAQASDMSGWLLLGLPGLAFGIGMGSMWTAIGLSLGTLLNWLFISRRLRNYTGLSDHLHCQITLKCDFGITPGCFVFCRPC